MKTSKNKKTEMNATKIVCAAIYVLMIAGTLVTVGNVGQYIDMPSAIVVVVISVLFAATTKSDDSII